MEMNESKDRDKCRWKEAMGGPFLLDPDQVNDGELEKVLVITHLR